MANPAYFKEAFNALATDGCIGVPNGIPAYAYVRVSSAGQAEEGRNGLPRQIQHIHEIAAQRGYSIPWGLVFADDHTGFEFEDRPELSKLRREVKGRNRRASALLIENLDRLSRHADWHQGYLLDEFKKNNIAVVFWKEFNSRVERAVMGAIAQDAMQDAIARMTNGTLSKARDGRITSKIAAYGYKFVDAQGKESAAARKDTHYAIDDEQAAVVRFIFDSLAYGGHTVRWIALELDKRCPPPRAKSWGDRTIARIVHSSLYKGEYIANRHYKEYVTEVDEFGEPHRVMKEHIRPESEWVITPVPAIVDAGTWELAGKAMWQNKVRSPRNRKHNYMVSGLLRCATCGYHWHGHTEYGGLHIQRYWCSKRHVTPSRRKEAPCDQPSIRCEIVDNAVWEALTTLLMEPHKVTRAIEDQYNGEGMQRSREQYDYLIAQIAERDREADKLYKAYQADAYTPEDFAAERQRILASQDKLRNDAERVKASLITPEEVEAKKQRALQQLELARRASEVSADLPFEAKKKIIGLMVDYITINVNEGWIDINGTIRVPIDHSTPNP